SAICVRTPQDVFDLWRNEHGLSDPSLPAEIWRIQEELERDLDASVTPESTMGISNELAVKGGKAANTGGHLTTRYVKNCQGVGQCLQGCRGGEKKSMNLTFVPETLQRGGTVVSCAQVKKIKVRRKRVVGVSGRFVHPMFRHYGARFTIRARKAVVLGASATRSPALMLHSGIRSKALGKYFRAHPGTGVFGCYDDPVDQNIGATQGWASIKFRQDGLKLETLSIPLALVAGRLKGGGRILMERLREYRHMAMWCHAVRATAVGQVTSSIFGNPVVKYSLNQRDMRTFRHGMVLVSKTHFAAGASAIIPGVHGLPYRLGPDELHQLEDGPLDPRAYTAILSHLFGGCVMGTDSRRAVCDPHGRVYGYDGLVVVDASVIPTTLGVNPQHTIMALARFFSERLLDS
ncbi:MAG: GMC family oxidoreductase, partial [Proteobacteria bacterium]|nr:GMC family oxidoreductase [Pseudomonadota bacterium]